MSKKANQIMAVCNHTLCTRRATAMVNGNSYCRAHASKVRVDIARNDTQPIDIAHAIRDALDSNVGVDCMVNGMIEHINHRATITTMQTDGNSKAQTMIALDNGVCFRVIVEKC